MPSEDVFHQEPRRRKRTPAGRALFTMLLTLAVGLFLNADRISLTAERQPFGWKRTWAMRVMEPVQDVSHWTGLNQPRRLLAAATHNEDPPLPKSTESVVTAPPTTVASVTTTTLPQVLRVPTREAPLRILAIGDSLSGWTGPALTDELEGRPVSIDADFQVGTGLARPDVTNWPAVLQQKVTADDPDVVVLTFGGNDDQDMNGPNGHVTVGTAAWAAEYERRVAQVLAIAQSRHRLVYWVGVPLVRKAHLEAAATVMNAIAQREVAARPGAHYIDARKILSPTGEFEAYLGDSKIREADGVHPTLSGVKLEMAPVVAQLILQFHLPPG
ncbi:MAG TPA: DUF459 domain-containing protein [Acidimicrobiales bacterium]